MLDVGEREYGGGTAMIPRLQCYHRCAKAASPQVAAFVASVTFNSFTQPILIQTSCKNLRQTPCGGDGPH